MTEPFLPSPEWLFLKNRHLAPSELAGYLDDILAPEHRNLIEKHLNNCEQCREQIGSAKECFARCDDAAEVDRLVRIGEEEARKKLGPTIEGDVSVAHSSTSSSPVHPRSEAQAAA